jgi:hypothetical protein
MCNHKKILEETLEQKIQTAEEISKWFGTQYSPAFTEDDKLREWEDLSRENNAQIKLIRYLVDKF